jgi:hypothetical protein
MNMEIIKVKIDGREYELYSLNILGREVTVASYKLNRKLDKMIEQERYHEIKHIDSMYSYFLPKEVDHTDENEIRDSIESVMREDLETT